jgi:hypothetical protein
MAKFKSQPNHEFIRPNVYVQFNSYGAYVTNKEDEIKLLEGLAPFVKRVEDKPKAEAKPKKSAQKDGKKK